MASFLHIFLSRILIFAAVLGVAIWPRASAAETPPVIAAASNLRFVLGDLADIFKRQTGLAVRLSYGSSGNITRQISQGAPYQMFLSADETYVRDLAAQGRTLDEGQLYAYGRIALFLAKGSRLADVNFPAGYGAAFAVPKQYRFAIASPVHAPYGRAAREALIHAGLWTVMQPSLLYGENVSQAAQFAASGSADGGIIAHSLALTLKGQGRGDFWLIPAAWHAALGQRMVLLQGAGETARKFYAFMGGEIAHKLLLQHGFMGRKS